jgi:hypothetical protein
MNTTKKLICILAAGATLGTAAPVFADSWHDRNYDHYRRGDRDHGRRDYRQYDRHHVAVVERPYVVQRAYVVERPVYYGAPAPMQSIGPAAMVGAAIGGYIDNRQ